MKSHLQTMLISAVTTVSLGALVLAVSAAIAAPTQAPPGGNPTFPLQGAQGPQGPAGTGAIIGCTTTSANLNPGGTQVSCPAGYTWATGGGVHLSSGPGNYLDSYPLGGTTWWCNAANASGTCFVTCCK